MKLRYIVLIFSFIIGFSSCSNIKESSQQSITLNIPKDVKSADVSNTNSIYILQNNSYSKLNSNGDLVYKNAGAFSTDYYIIYNNNEVFLFSPGQLQIYNDKKVLQKQIEIDASIKVISAEKIGEKVFIMSSQDNQNKTAYSVDENGVNKISVTNVVDMYVGDGDKLHIISLGGADKLDNELDPNTNNVTNTKQIYFYDFGNQIEYDKKRKKMYILTDNGLYSNSNWASDDKLELPLPNGNYKKLILNENLYYLFDFTDGIITHFNANSNNTKKQIRILAAKSFSDYVDVNNPIMMAASDMYNNNVNLDFIFSDDDNYQFALQDAMTNNVADLTIFASNQLMSIDTTKMVDIKGIPNISNNINADVLNKIQYGGKIFYTPVDIEFKNIASKLPLTNINTYDDYFNTIPIGDAFQYYTYDYNDYVYDYFKNYILSKLDFNSKKINIDNEEMMGIIQTAKNNYDKNPASGSVTKAGQNQISMENFNNPEYNEYIKQPAVSSTSNIYNLEGYYIGMLAVSDKSMYSAEFLAKMYDKTNMLNKSYAIELPIYTDINQYPALGYSNNKMDILKNYMSTSKNSYGIFNSQVELDYNACIQGVASVQYTSQAIINDLQSNMNSIKK